jgi:signal transduction histidine kinase
LVQSLNQTLQNKIDEAKKGLEEANKKLKESDQVKDDFISMASHQLSTPLAVIDGYLTLANQGVYGKLNDKLSNAISAAAERAQVMKSLLVDLLDISRMTAGKFMLQIEPGDINKVVKREFDQLNDLAMEKSVDYNFHPPREPIPSINLDSQKTGQAVMNLIHNALHYAAGKKVDVYLDSDDNNVIFKVIDNGIGVPEEQKAKLFTKFYRATNAKKERPNGTGIGLYLVKRVVEDQGGKIIFESKVNNGSTFGFTLPKKINKTSTE